MKASRHRSSRGLCLRQPYLRSELVGAAVGTNLYGYVYDFGWQAVFVATPLGVTSNFYDGATVLTETRYDEQTGILTTTTRSSNASDTIEHSRCGIVLDSAKDGVVTFAAHEVLGRTVYTERSLTNGTVRTTYASGRWIENVYDARRHHADAPPYRRDLVLNIVNSAGGNFAYTYDALSRPVARASRGNSKISV